MEHLAFVKLFRPHLYGCYKFQFTFREIRIIIGHWPFGMLVIKMSASFIAIDVAVAVAIAVGVASVTWCCCHCQRST